MNNSNSLPALKMPKAETIETIDIHHCEPHHHHITMEDEAGDCGGMHSCGTFCSKVSAHSGKHYCRTCRTEF